MNETPIILVKGGKYRNADKQILGCLKLINSSSILEILYPSPYILTAHEMNMMKRNVRSIGINIKNIFVELIAINKYTVGK